MFACFGLLLYACKKYFLIQCLIRLLTTKSILFQIDIYVIQSHIIFVEYIKQSCIVLYHIVQSLIWYFHMSQLYLLPFPETFLALRTHTELITVLFQCFFSTNIINRIICLAAAAGQSGRGRVDARSTHVHLQRTLKAVAYTQAGLLRVSSLHIPESVCASCYRGKVRDTCIRCAMDVC